MIIAFELDDIISSPVSNFMALSDAEKCTVKEKSKETIDQLKTLGHTIVIFTKRDASLMASTEYWLQKNKIQYDRILFNKPQYDMLVDTKCFKFTSWDDLLEKNKYRLHNS
jgi:uncharacterized HAD superfamily protein